MNRHEVDTASSVTHLSQVRRRVVPDVLRRVPRTAMNHGVERPLVKSHIDRGIVYALHVTHVHAAPRDAVLGVLVLHEVDDDRGEVDTELALVAAGGEFDGDSLERRDERVSGRR